MWILWGQEPGLQKAVTELFLNALEPGPLTLRRWKVGRERGSSPWKDLWAGGGLSQGSRVPGHVPFRETPQLFPARPVSAPSDSVTTHTRPTSSLLASPPPREPGFHPDHRKCSINR